MKSMSVWGPFMVWLDCGADHAADDTRVIVRVRPGSMAYKSLLGGGCNVGGGGGRQPWSLFSKSLRRLRCAERPFCNPPISGRSAVAPGSAWLKVLQPTARRRRAMSESAARGITVATGIHGICLASLRLPYPAVPPPSTLSGSGAGTLAGLIETGVDEHSPVISSVQFRVMTLQRNCSSAS